MGDHKDRQASLIVFGLFEILGGLLMSFFCLLTLIPVSMRQAESPQLFSAHIIYAGLAVWLITMGIGTIRGRRWARLLMLAGSWIFLAVGAVAMVMIILIMPQTLQGNMSKDSAAVVFAFVVCFTALIYLLFPAVGVLFYRGPNVRATFEQRDPDPSWAEKCPLSILILVMMLAMVWLSVGTMGGMNFVLPVFGTLISGWAGAGVLLAVAGICTALIPGVYRCRMYAWWCVVILLVLGMTSQLITFSRMDLMEYYVRAGYSDQMIEMMRQQNWASVKTFSWMALLYGLPALVYLVVIRRCFKTGELTEARGR